jgi:hypothetical protein
VRVNWQVGPSSYTQQTTGSNDIRVSTRAASSVIAFPHAVRAVAGIHVKIHIDCYLHEFGSIASRELSFSFNFHPLCANSVDVLSFLHSHLAIHVSA